MNMRTLAVSAACLIWLCGSSGSASAANPQSELVQGAMFGNVKKVTKALQEGAEVDGLAPNNIMTALMWASYKGHSQIVKILLDEGADADNRNKSGMTALMYAARKGRFKVIKILLDHGADRSIEDNAQKTATDWAAKEGRHDVVKLLEERE